MVFRFVDVSVGVQAGQGAVDGIVAPRHADTGDLRQEREFVQHRVFPLEFPGQIGTAFFGNLRRLRGIQAMAFLLRTETEEVLEIAGEVLRADHAGDLPGFDLPDQVAEIPIESLRDMADQCQQRGSWADLSGAFRAELLGKGIGALKLEEEFPFRAVAQFRKRSRGIGWWKGASGIKVPSPMERRNEPRDGIAGENHIAGFRARNGSLKVKVAESKIRRLKLRGNCAPAAFSNMDEVEGGIWCQDRHGRGRFRGRIC